MAQALTKLGRVLRNVSAVLHEVGSPHSYAVVGGLAVSARVEPRFTRDIDLAMATRDDAEAEALVHRLLGAGYRVVQALEHDAGRMATVRLLPPGGRSGQIVVDLLFASSGIEPELVRKADVIEVLPDVFLPVAQVGHLIVLKLLSVAEGRPNDTIDLAALAGSADAAAWALAAESVPLVTARGFDRGRDLSGDLAALSARYRAASAGSA